MEVRTRFAPSPTGYMHIGNLRTALYEYLIAKSQGGKFILRIEDTDQGRLVEGSLDVIYKTMKMTGLQHDEGPDVGGEYGPYVQSERMGLYMDYAKELVEKGEAYYCFCTKERIDAARAEAEAKAARERAARAERNRLAREKAAASGKKVPETKPETEPVREERVADTKGGYAMTKAEKRLSDDFASNKGRLPYPVSGRHTIVAAFGEQQHQELKYVRTNNSGIDIQTAPGTDARAVFNGEVTRVFVVPGYNNSVIVRHGNYLTVYSNLSQVYVKAGDKVSTRQAIGKIFTDTEDGNATILHFQLWKEKTKLNPAPWLD